jgi:hypothetical protein
MKAQFHYFTLEEVYQYAEKMGYSREDVEILEDSSYDYDNDLEILEGYEVSFGHECTEMWSWYFEDLTQPATEYDHLTWED